MSNVLLLVSLVASLTAGNPPDHVVADAFSILSIPALEATTCARMCPLSAKEGQV
jgi:hypothetical protein